MSIEKKITFLRNTLRLFLLGAKIPFKPDFNDEYFKQARTYLKKYKWNKLENHIKAIKTADEYSQLIISISNWPGNPNYFEKWCEALPTSRHAFLAKGAHGVLWAWEGRSYATSDKVSNERWEEFSRRVATSRKDLLKAHQLNPIIADPFTYLIMLEMGIGEDLDELFNLFMKGITINKSHIHLHHNMLFSLTEKWGGSSQQMFDFARATCAKLPQNDPLYALIAQAHVEEWIYLTDFEGEAEKANYHMRSRKTQNEITIAYNKAEPSLAALPESLANFSCGIFAAAFYLSDQKGLAKKVINKMGGTVNEYPWNSLFKIFRIWEVLDPGYVVGRIKKEVSRG